MRHRTRAYGSLPRPVAAIGVLLWLLLLLGAVTSRADAAFERDVGSAEARAACDAGPHSQLIDLLMRPERGSRWCLQATSSELYGLAELRCAALALSRESPGACLCAGVSSLGGRLYREMTVEVMGARRWSEDVAVGLHGRALSLSWEGGATEWSGAADCSAAWLVHGRLVIGLSVRNVAHSSILSSPVASRVSGEAALVLDGMTVLASLSGEPGFAPSPAIGCELPLASWTRVRAGLRAEPASAAFGLSFGRGRTKGRTRWPDLGLAWEWHPVLGVSSSLTVTMWM